MDRSYNFYCSGCLPREPIPLSITGRLPSSPDLETYALDQWEVRRTDLKSEHFLLFCMLPADGNKCTTLVHNERIHFSLLRLKNSQPYFLPVLFLFQAYSLNTLTDVQRVAIKDLAVLGLGKLLQIWITFHLRADIGNIAAGLCGCGDKL
ncbi:hypothetical protein HU200_016570 [Digitaria exilis]|uniref:Uncharacterized protein n=1 Tax=Digitaria exilis TaxID=1010633 RepID=A0A835F7G3_9POAL|nr:hypothetical protein HU200_016570 [Digitaria exilis]